MTKFDYQEKLEGWVEGIVDLLQAYIWTVARLTRYPFRSTLRFASTDALQEFISPAVYFILSYIVMCFLIQDVDFSDRFFFVDIADRLDAFGVLNAAKTIKVEALITSIFPAIILLIFFVLIATSILRLTDDTIDPHLIRRNYSFVLGGAFLTIGSVSGGYHYLVKPIAAYSWWLGLPIHCATMFPMFTVISPMLAIQYIGKPSFQQFFTRWIAIMIPLLGIMCIMKTLIGSFYLILNP